MVEYVNKITTTYFIYQRNISRIRRTLTSEAITTLVEVFIVSMLGNHNSVLYVVHDKHITAACPKPGTLHHSLTQALILVILVL